VAAIWLSSVFLVIKAALWLSAAANAMAGRQQTPEMAELLSAVTRVSRFYPE
jgi:hypothetical protein